MDEAKRRETKEVAAIRYDPDEDNVPVLVALGQGYVAEKILEKAEEHDIPVVQDEGLAKVLGKLSVGDEIPPEVYQVVAQVLLFVSSMDSSYGEKIKNKAK